jgi:CheY-like chemotaxis protein
MGVSMTKILLVEDDKSLREIYGVRLLAEGYQITSAGDGEEALAMAVKERPDLIISDVMMPKISGFDMLDILRSTPETKDLKVIMMTALSSEDQRARGESLGANRYLVKSQVGIEDVVRTVHDVLADSPITKASASQAFTTPAFSAAATPKPTPAQTAKPTPTPTPMPAPTPATPAPMAAPAPIARPAPMPAPASVPTPMATPVAPTPTPVQATPVPLPQPIAPYSTPAPAGDLTINPISPITPPADIATLINQELNGTSITPPPAPKV